MIRTIKRSIIATVTLMTLLSFISIGCSTPCGPTTAEIENLKPMVSSITVGYDDGTTIELTPDSAYFNEVCDEALRIALSIDKQCLCIADFQTVEQLSETNKEFVYILFLEPVEITTCISIDEEKQEYITTNEDGYRIISTTEVVIFPQESLPEIWAGCETGDTGTKCGMWGSARSMDTLNSIINNLR